MSAGFEVVAHRGGPREIEGRSRHEVELTLAAYERALSVGADSVECDVRLTVDGEMVLFHDRTLERVAGSDHVVSSLTHAQLRELVPTVLTLRDLAVLIRDHDRRVEIAIETKHPVRYGGLVEERLAGLLHEFGWTEGDSPVRVMSFQHSAVRRMHRLLPRLRLVQLLHEIGYWRRIQALTPRDWIIGPGVQLLREHPEVAAWARARSQAMHVWTVNSDEDLDYCLSLGMSACITDRPEWALARRASLD